MISSASVTVWILYIQLFSNWLIIPPQLLFSTIPSRVYGQNTRHNSKYMHEFKTYRTTGLGSSLSCYRRLWKHFNPSFAFDDVSVLFFTDKLQCRVTSWIRLEMESCWKYFPICLKWKITRTKFSCKKFLCATGAQSQVLSLICILMCLW